jgi:hypothetical protein
VSEKRQDDRQQDAFLDTDRATNAPPAAAATFAADLIQRQVAFEQLCDPLAGIEHAGLHRILRRADDLGDFGDRFFVIVDEVDDLAVRRRQLRQALPQDGDVVLLLRDHLELRYTGGCCAS